MATDSRAARLVPAKVRGSWGVIRRLAVRQIEMRYRDSFLGLGWAILAPLILLIIYTIIYSTVFKARWPRPDGKEGNFALYIFSGLVLFVMVADLLNTATSLAQNNSTLIKRTTMNVRLIPIASSFGALMSFVLSLVPLLLMYVILEGVPPWTLILYPIPVAILWLASAGLAMIVASASPYFRDAMQIVPLLTTSLLFLSPIFYSITAVPEPLRTIMVWLNPLATIIPASQDLLFFGTFPPLVPLLGWGIASVVIWWLGLTIFTRAARGFADVM